MIGNGFGSTRRRARALGAGFTLVAAGCLLLAPGIRHSPTAANNLPDSPMVQTAFSVRRNPANTQANLRSWGGGLPLIFEPNQGQAAANVRFLAHGIGYGLFLDSAGAVLAVPAPPAKSASRVAALRVKLVNANPHAALYGTGLLPGHSNYLLGNDPGKWRRNIPQFAGVQYKDIYPGIDLVFYGNRGRLEYDFHVAAGADPSRAEIEFDGANGLALHNGDLILDGEAGDRVLFHAPHIYQRFGDREQSVSGGFVVHAGNRAGFEIGPYDRSRELIIDPIPEIESYFGGSGSDTSPSIAVDLSGSFIYLAGTTTSPANSFPLTGTIPTQLGPGANVFVAKIEPTSPPSVSYITFLGGSTAGADSATGVAVDGSGDAYLVGNTTSSDFPTTQTTAYQTAPETKTVTCTATCSSIFVSVLNPTGSGFLNYSSYLSGDGNDVSSGMTIDANGNVFITGTTTSNDQPSITDLFPATEAPPAAQTGFQTFPLAPLQFFVTKVNTVTAGGASIAYSTYFGGETPSDATAVGGGITVDASGNIYFSGTTSFVFTGTGRPPDFPILNAYQPCLDTPPPTVITSPVTCPNTTSTTNADAFVAKLNPNTVQGQQLKWSTYLGGTGTDSSTGVAIDSGAANVYITGTTNSTDFIVPTGTAAFQSTCAPASGGTCAYVGRFNNPSSTNMNLTYFSYIGGNTSDGSTTNGLALSVDTASGALVTGSTNSPNLPVTAGALQSVLNGTGGGTQTDAFFARIDTATVAGQTGIGSYLTYFGGSGNDRGTSITTDRNTNTYFAGDTDSTNLPTDNPLQSTRNGASNEFFAKLGTAADLCMNCVAPTVSPIGEVGAGNQVTTKFTVINNGPDLATNVVVTGSTSSSSVAFKSASATTGTCTTQVSGGNITCTVDSLQPGASATITFNVVPSASGNYQVTATVSSSLNSDPNPNNDTAQAPFTASDFSVGVAPSSQPVSAGQTATYTVTLTPNPVYSTSISLSASGQPNATTASFQTSSLTPGQSPVSTTLSLATTARTQPTANLKMNHSLYYVFWVGLPGLMFVGLGTRGKGRRKRIFGGLLVLLVGTLILLQPACKSSTQQIAAAGTQPGTYTINVIATSGSVTHTATCNLTVQ